MVKVVSRRGFIGLLGGGLVATQCAWAGGGTDSLFVQDQASTLPATLSAFVDVLIPADELTSSASQLGVDRMFLELGQRNPAFMKWLFDALAWFQLQAPQGFANLPDSEQLVIVERLASSPSGSPARNIFEVLRFHCMGFYYADSRSWNGLAISRPPQPIGYPDFSG